MTKRYGLHKSTVKKAVREFVDYDYLDQLTEAEKDYLDKFSREFYNGDIAATAPVHPPIFKLRLYAANNSRNRDVFSMWRRGYDYPMETIADISGIPNGSTKKS